MQRVIRLKQEDLEWAARTTPESRLSQANCAFRLFHELHQPFAKPFVRGFATLEEFFRFEREHTPLGRPLAS
jgi:hypothetical protein